MSPEAALGGWIARVENGDMIRLDPEAGRLELLVDEAELSARAPSAGPDELQTYGRDLFQTMRNTVSTADLGGSVFEGA